MKTPTLWLQRALDFGKKHGTKKMGNILVASNIFYFHPYLGRIPILTNIFQMGWNHQPGKVLYQVSHYKLKVTLQGN